MKKVNEIKCEGVVTGLTFHKEHLMVSDDAFGIKSYDFSGNELWSCEVPGGVSMFKIANNFIAIVDNLGRLLTADFTGGLINIELKSFPTERKRSIALNLGYNPNFHFNKHYLTYQGGKTDFLGFDDGTREILSLIHI